MQDLVKKFTSLAAEIEKKKGDFSLFALFLREDAPDRWDLLVSAPWVGQNKEEALDYMIAEIKAYLGSQDLINLSRIVFVDPDAPQAQAFNRAFQVEQGIAEVTDSNLFGLPIRHAFIIKSKRPEAPVAR